MSMQKLKEEFEKWFASADAARQARGRTAFTSLEKTFMSMAWQAARPTNSLCPGHGRAECVSCCWPAAEQSTGYTAVDRCTAAADGYRSAITHLEGEIKKRDQLLWEMRRLPQKRCAAFIADIIDILDTGGKVK